ncbi:neuropathy target esterase sws isoform X3 [Diabrotica virgifera virgifera]|uniref:Neuropathy target esterase sws n=1 Tax=Diabrotica virgifera virgifera TaxID=50390 RepID=A0ABM5K7R5_DIAVI|nr:neuropathy target esterase sws isoform X3 [Diabrotica virgifera virgifera]
MDVINAIKNFNTDFGIINKSTWLVNLVLQFQETYGSFYVVLLGLILITTTLVVYCLRRCTRKVFKPKESISQETTRFRKRDKALFYGRKMIRKVKNISGQVRNSGQGKKRKMVMKFARRLLQLKKETDQEQLKVLEPPAEYLQEDMLSDDRMPPDALYMLQSIRVFGHFEKPIFLKLCKHTEIINVHAGAYLFRIGDPDEHVYIVQSGKLSVSITGNDGLTTLKIVKPGESVTSLLSFTDVLTGHTSPYKTVSAKAIEDSMVVKLPMSAFQEIFQEYPDIFVRVLQVIMVRLQRVTFTALHQYLGLSAELVRQHPKQKNSPMKKKKEESSLNTTLTETPTATTQPIPVPGHRRSKSSLESKSFSPSGNFGNGMAESDSIPSGTVSDCGSIPKKRLSIQNPDINDEELIEVATEAFVKELGLEDLDSLKGKVEIREVSAGTYLMKEDSNKDAALVYIIAGALVVSQRVTEGEEEVHMFTAHPGEIVGGLAVLTGEPSFFTIRAKHLTRIALISKSTFYTLMKDQPKIVLHIAHSVVRRLSPFVRQVDFALDWIFMESGRAIYRQDDESDSTYIVLSGRLRSVITHKNGKKELVGEYGKGDLIGVVEMVTQTKRSTTVIAVRDSELAKLPEGLFNAIKLRYPIVVTRLIKLLGHRILGTWKKPALNIHDTNSPAVDTRPSSVNFSTVAIVAASDDVPLTAFTYELNHCLSAIGSTLRLTSDVVRKTLGNSIMDPNNEYRLSNWLAQQEDQHRISLYQCDLTVSAWTQRCIRQADCILIVGLGDNHPSLGKVEKEIERLAIRTQKELVLLHREGGKPKNTIAWLNMRSWVSSHHHILCPNRVFARKSVNRINELYSKIHTTQPNVHSDFSRLARWLTGKSVGLVLGGGGARGSAHVGMIKAIYEAGIPIDMVGGVSIGAFMGALWCQERNMTTMTQKAREWSKKMTQWWRQILDLTYPMTSMFSGKDFNHTIKSTFSDTYIEDLWLPYFTVTTDITSSCMRIHSHGSLWRYVRSSMSLSGYMPPLCDPIDGHLLLDGGYTNNLPADVMRSLGANHILAIDVGSVDDQDLTNYGDDLSGWWLLWKRWNPFTQPVKVPNLPDIQSRLAYVSCVRQLEEVKNSDYCEYIRPPIDRYRTLQFGSFDEIREVGYQHGKAYFEGQLRAGNLPIVKNIMDVHRSSTTSTQSSLGNYTFTDLAQMVCKVSRPYEEEESNSSSSSEDEGRDGYASEPTVGISETENIIARRTGGSLSLSENELESDVDFDVNQRNFEKVSH